MLNLFFAIFDAVLPFRENRIVNKLYTIKLNFWHLPKKNVKTNIKIGKILVYKIGLKFRYIIGWLSDSLSVGAQNYYQEHFLVVYEFI